MLAVVEGQRLHAFTFFDHAGEAVQHVIRPSDHTLDDVALVRHADVARGVAADHAIAANETELTCQHLVRRGAVVRVEQNDVVRLGAVDLGSVTQAQHVLRVLALAFVAHARLCHHERLEAFLAQAVQHVAGGNVGVALGTALVLALGEDRGSDLADLVVGQRGVGAEDVDVAAETGCQCVAHLNLQTCPGKPPGTVVGVIANHASTIAVAPSPVKRYL